MPPWFRSDADVPRFAASAAPDEPLPRSSVAGPGFLGEAGERGDGAAIGDMREGDSPWVLEFAGDSGIATVGTVDRKPGWEFPDIFGASP